MATQANRKSENLNLSLNAWLNILGVTGLFHKLVLTFGPDTLEQAIVAFMRYVADTEAKRAKAEELVAFYDRMEMLTSVALKAMRVERGAYLDPTLFAQLKKELREFCTLRDLSRNAKEFYAENLELLRKGLETLTDEHEYRYFQEANYSSVNPYFEDGELAS